MNLGAKELKGQLPGHGDQKKFVERYNEALPESEQIDQPTLSRWLASKRIPLPLHLRRIEDLTGIRMQAWTERESGSGGAAA